MLKNTVDIITLGCSKNLVDSERLICQLKKAGYKVTHDAVNPRGEIVVINTCGFIGDAKEESINMILDFCQAKENGRLKKLYVMGCLSERYKSELEDELPLVDKFYGKFNWNDLLNDLGNAEFSAQTDERCLTTPPHYAYIKISEGCDRKCAYCAIPIITGKHKSRPMEDIISEIEKMVSEGVREFQLIAQELTYYGIDLYKKQKIAELVGRISDIDGVEWIRLHYAYPQNFPDDLLEVMRERKNVCKYLDIALQHVDTKVLSNMRRNITKEETYDFIKHLRDEVPGIHLRTTLMVGYPGEHDEEFAQLKDFIKWAKFERMGAFAYCEEDDTYAAKNFKDEISDEEKQRRLSEIMELQQSISAQVQASKIGKVMKVVIDRKEGEYYIGRTEFDSPEVDPEVLIPVSEGRMFVGRFYNVKIIDSDDFDLYATKIIGGSRGDK